MSFLRSLIEMSLKVSDPDKEGHRSIDYHPDSPDDDDPMLKPFTSTKGKGYHAPTEQFADILGGHIGSYRDNKHLDKLVKENPGVLQSRVPRYYGFTHESPPTASHKRDKNYNLSPEEENQVNQYSEPFLKAMKGKPNEMKLKFKPKAMNALVKRGAQDVVHKMKTTSHSKIHFDKFDQTFILPAPSSAGLSDHFAKELQKALKEQGVHAEIIKDFMHKRRIPRASGVWATQNKTKRSSGHFFRESIDNLKRIHPGDTRANKIKGYGYGSFQSDALRALYNQLLNKNIATEDEIRKTINREFDDLEYEVMELEDRLNANPSPKEKKQITAALNAHQDAIADKPDILRKMEKAIKSKKKEGWNGKTIDKNARLSMAKFSNIRNQISDFTKHNTKHPDKDRMTDPNKKTLLIFSDDNIDSGATVDDFYRHMFKEGLLHKNMHVVAAALHKMTTSRSTYGGHLQGYRDQGQGKEKKAPNQNSVKSSPTRNKPTPKPIPTPPRRPTGNMNQALEYAQDEMNGELTGLKYNPKHPKINALAADISDELNIPHNDALNAIRQAMTGVSESFIDFLIL